MRIFFFSEWEKPLEFEAEGQEFAKILRLLKVMKSQNEYMKSSNYPKYEENIREISALEDYID